MLVGVHEDYWNAKARTTLSATLKAFPATAVGREFYSDIATASLPSLISPMVTKCAPFWAAGQSVVWSFKPNPADVANGKLKPLVSQLADYIQHAGLANRVYLCIWHEPENDFKIGPEFVRMFNTVHGWLKAVEPAIQTTHAALGYYYRNITPAQAKQWITQADVHSIDLYSGRSFPIAMTLPDSKAYQTWKAALPAGSRWGVSERGFIAAPADSAARVRTINSEAAWLAGLKPAERPEFFVTWNTPGTENDPKIPLDAPARDAMNALFARVG